MAKKVRVYSTPSCPWCIKVKDYLKQSKVAFEDVDVSANVAAAQEMIKKSGQMGVPVLEVDGDVVVGFDKVRLDKLLGLGG